MTRTTAAIAAATAVFALLIAGCGDDNAAPATSTTSGMKAAGGEAIDNVKSGTFVVSYRSAFPKLADSKDDTKIRSILVDTCQDIKGGKSEDEVVQNVIGRTRSGAIEASKEEAQAIYQMAKMLC